MTEKTKTIMGHSYRGGTGKSTILSNIAVALAKKGSKVIIIDADIISPGIHSFFGLDNPIFDKTFTDYLVKRTDIDNAVYDISETFKLPDNSLMIVPSSIHASSIAELDNTIYSRVDSAIENLKRMYEPDYVLIDTHPGLAKESLSFLNSADLVLNILKPDNQDYQGIELMSHIANKNQVNMLHVVNQVYNADIIEQIEKSMNITIFGRLLYEEDIVLDQSSHVLFDRNPKHRFSKEIARIISVAT